MFDPLRMAERPDAPHANEAPAKREAVADIHATLLDCLTRLDKIGVNMAAAHLSMCIDVLGRDFNPD